jgi:hypothetical protein
VSASSLPVYSLINYHSGGEKDIMKPLFIDDNFSTYQNLQAQTLFQQHMGALYHNKLLSTKRDKG